VRGLSTLAHSRGCLTIYMLEKNTVLTRASIDESDISPL
jgi:hypothetical protein